MIALTRTAGGKCWETWRDLMAYIVKTYHDSLKAALPRLEGLMDQVARERRVPIHLLDRLLREFSALADSLRTHLSQQEGHLFPMIRHVCLSVEEAGWPCHLGDAVEELIDEATRDDQEAMASVNRVEEGLGRMEWEGKGPLVGKLVKGLRELGEDLEEHIQLETSVLFPVVRALLRGNNQTIKRLLEEGSRSQTGPPLERSVHASAFNRWLNTGPDLLSPRDVVEIGAFQETVEFLPPAPLVFGSRLQRPRLHVQGQPAPHRHDTEDHHLAMKGTR